MHPDAYSTATTPNDLALSNEQSPPSPICRRVGVGEPDSDDDSDFDDFDISAEFDEVLDSLANWEDSPVNACAALEENEENYENDRFRHVTVREPRSVVRELDFTIPINNGISINNGMESAAANAAAATTEAPVAEQSSLMATIHSIFYI